MIWGTNKKGLNIDLTEGQYQYLYDLVMTAYELDVPEQKDWDMQTYDNLVDNVCNAKETYLREDTKGVRQSKLWHNSLTILLKNGLIFN